MCKKDARNILAMILSGHYKNAKKEIDKIKGSEDFDAECASVYISLTALIQVLNNEDSYKNIMCKMQDAAELARITKSDIAELFKEYVLAELSYKNNDLFVALCRYNNAKNISNSMSYDYGIFGYIVSRIKQIRDNQGYLMTPTSDPLVSLVKIGRSITAQTDIDVLLKVIAEETKIALQADRCTVFLLDK